MVLLILLARLRLLHTKLICRLRVWGINRINLNHVYLYLLILLWIVTIAFHALAFAQLPRGGYPLVFFTKVKFGSLSCTTFFCHLFFNFRNCFSIDNIIVIFVTLFKICLGKVFELFVIHLIHLFIHGALTWRLEFIWCVFIILLNDLILNRDGKTSLLFFIFTFHSIFRFWNGFKSRLFLKYRTISLN